MMEPLFQNVKTILLEHSFGEDRVYRTSLPHWNVMMPGMGVVAHREGIHWLCAGEGDLNS